MSAWASAAINAASVSVRLSRVSSNVIVLCPFRGGGGGGERVGSAPELGGLCIRLALPIGVAKCGFVADGQNCDDEESSHVVLPFKVVVLSDVSSIGYSALNVNPILEQFQNFWKVFYFPQGCRLASPMPIMARGIRMAASIVIVMMSIVLPLQ